MRKKDKQSRFARRRVQRRRFVAALLSIGGLNPTTIIAVTGLVVVVNIFSGELEDVLHFLVDTALRCLLRGWSSAVVSGPFTSAIVFLSLLAAFSGTVLALLRLSKKHWGEERPRVFQESPRPVVAIVLFLSLPNKEALAKLGVVDFGAFTKEIGHRLRLTGLHVERSGSEARSLTPNWGVVGHGAFTKDELNELYHSRSFNWRMNIEAIAPHIGHASPLRHVVIVPSSQSTIGGKHTAGSDVLLQEALVMLKELLVQHGMEDVAVTGCGELKGTGKPLPESVAYENLKDIVYILYDITKALKDKYRCGERDILVDITSGKGLTNAAAMAFATLVEERRVQYVDTESYCVRTFDVTHDIEIGG